MPRGWSHGERHGESVSGRWTPEYRAWIAMKWRCSPENPQSKDYSERGIFVCREWAESYSSFLAHVGRRPSRGYSIDRLDNERGYEPGNVAWRVRKDQNRNRRSTKMVTAHGFTLALGRWAELTGVNYDCMKIRLQHGWAPERAIFTPVKSVGRFSRQS